LKAPLLLLYEYLLTPSYIIASSEQDRHRASLADFECNNDAAKPRDQSDAFGHANPVSAEKRALYWNVCSRSMFQMEFELARGGMQQCHPLLW
jgi:hypothetical protein